MSEWDDEDAPVDLDDELDEDELDLGLDVEDEDDWGSADDEG